jgi:hypothetical protein
VLAAKELVKLVRRETSGTVPTSTTRNCSAKEKTSSHERQVATNF